MRLSMKVDNMYKCFAYVTRTQAIFAVISLTRKGNSFRVSKYATLYTNFSMVFSVVGMIVGLNYKISNPATSKFLRKISPLIIVIAVIECVSSIFNFCLMCTLMQFRKEYFIEIVDKVNVIDERLIAEFKVDMCYYKIMRKHIVISLLLIGYFIAAYQAVIAKLSEGDLFNTLFTCSCYAFIVLGLGCCGFMSTIFSDVLITRFGLLQKLTDEEYLTRRYQNATKRSRKICILIGAYQEYFALVNVINKLLSTPLGFVISHDFTRCTSQLFLLLWKASDIQNENNLAMVLDIMMVMLPSVAKMIIMPTSATRVLEGAHKCLHMMRKFDEHTPTIEVKNALANFMFWNKHNTAQFSIFGVLDINNSLMLAVVSGIASYLIVLVQFKMQEQLFDDLIK